MDTNVKINIFGTHSVMIANFNRKNIFPTFFTLSTIYKNIIYFFLISKVSVTFPKQIRLMSVWNIRNNLKIFLFIRISFNIYYMHEKWIRNPPKSNLINVTKALHVPKRDMCSKCGFASKQWNVLKHDICPKCVFCFTTVKCFKIK